MTTRTAGPSSKVPVPSWGRAFMVAAALWELGTGNRELHAQLGSFNPAPGPRGVYAIRNARIVPVAGPEMARGTVVIGSDGRIQAVGPDVAVPAGAQTIDASGLTVYP